MWKHVHLAARLTFVRPITAVTISVLMAFAIAINTALFSVIDGVLFKPLPFDRSERLVALGPPMAGPFPGPVSPRLLDELRNVATFKGVAAFIPQSTNDSAAGFENADLRVTAITPDFFAVLGASAVTGRVFDDRDQADRGQPRIVVGYYLWRNRLGARPVLADTFLTIGAQRFLVIGVVGSGFEFPRGTNVWTLIVPRAEPRYREFFHLTAVARIAGGVPLVDAQKRNAGLRVIPLAVAMRPNGAFSLAVLLAATTLILILSWIHVAGLQLADASTRMHDWAMRVALGASRSALAREAALRGAIVASVALTGALTVTSACTSFLVWMLPSDLTRGQPISLDMRTLVFASCLSAVGVLLFSMAPVRAIGRVSLVDVLRGSCSSYSATSFRFRAVLLTLQISATVVLLYLAGLTTHSFGRVLATDLGFDPDGLLAISIPTTVGSSHVSTEAHMSRFTSLAERARELKGVVRVAGASSRPLGSRVVMRVSASAAPHESIAAEFAAVTAEYFETLRIPIVSGRAVDATDGPRGSRVVNVSNTLGRRLRLGGHPAGRSILLNGLPVSVVGVVGDVRSMGADQPAPPQVYVPVSQWGPPSVLLVRAAGKDVSKAISENVVGATFGPDRLRIVTLDNEVYRYNNAHRSRSLLMSVLALVAVAMAAVGLYGSVSDWIGRRTREIGVRLALGADKRAIRRQVLWSMCPAVGGGLLLGVLGGIVAGRWASSLLFDVGAVDPATIAAVTALLASVMWYAAARPIKRVSEENLMRALMQL